MQRARRRFVCSAASLSSPSNTSLRLRGRSRTSSAAGDSLAVNRDFANNGLLTEIKPKLRSNKYNMRLLSSSHRNLKKSTKTKKAMKPPVSCFQNAIVIAPFHTLKKCFQSKLVDLYSMEKMKKISHRMRMAKKQNMSFEYDVLELDKVNAKMKTEKGKKAAGTTAAKKQKERSPSYCRCDMTPKQKPLRESFDNPEPMSFSSGGGKRRRLNTSLFTPTTLKDEINSNLLPFNPIETFRKSDTSIPRSGDSWESLRDSPSNGGEHLEGIIAISSTSFDSCLEQFDKESCNYLNPEKYDIRMMAREKRIDTEYIPRPTNDSRHMIMNNEMKNSDGNIADFMDREPQSQDISQALEQHLKPLRRQSKSKIKKPVTDTTEYYLRSKSNSKEKLFADRGGTQMNLERHGSRNNNFSKKRSVQIEVATQVENRMTQESRHRDDEQAPKDRTEGTDTELRESTNKVEIDNKDTEELVEPIVMEDSNEPREIDLLPRIEGEVIIPSKETPEPQDSDFIFGPRSMASRLGESCEFTFGRNWIFSDDEASEHGDRFY